MHIRRASDYTAMFTELDALIRAKLPQLELYCKIGRLVSSRPEKGAAVAVAEYLSSAYPELSGFSPRNVRRMREFYHTYEQVPEIFAAAMTIGWTQNVVILEAELVPQERAWYIHAVRHFGWSKQELQRRINGNAHLEMALDFVDDMCYTEEKNADTEFEAYDENPVRLPWEHLSESNGGVCDEGSGEEGWTGEAISHCVRSYQYRGDWESSLPTGPPEAGRAWDQLQRKNSPPVEKTRLRPIRSPDWNGQGEPAEYAPDLRRRLRWQNTSAAGVCRPP